MCSFQLPRPGLQLLQISSSGAAVPELLFPVLSKEQAQSQAPLRVRSNPQATSCSPVVSAGHGASTGLSAQQKEEEPRADPAGERRINSPIHFFVVPASHIPEVCKHRPPPHRADPVAELLEGFKHQLPREVPLIFVYKGSKQKG